jgi:ubiquinone/menaquinone biosynthesis C-methylase UbiE
MPDTQTKHIDANIHAHDTISSTYERLHVEIFNAIEQERLHACLKTALNFIITSSNPKFALDYGSGTGNLTRHLIELGCLAVSADISTKFLEMVRTKFNYTGYSSFVMTNGRDLGAVRTDSFDLTAVYSVLHHVPDYLNIVRELIRVTRPGGVIYIDHERNDSFWERNNEYEKFQEIAKSKMPVDFKGLIRKYSSLQNYVSRLRKIFNPRYVLEGDIHVWPDDHIEWRKIEDLFLDEKCEVVLRKDYLLYNRYPLDVYQAYKNKCSDMRVFIARKIS